MRLKGRLGGPEVVEMVGARVNISALRFGNNLQKYSLTS